MFFLQICVSSLPSKVTPQVKFYLKTSKVLLVYKDSTNHQNIQGLVQLQISVRYKGLCIEFVSPLEANNIHLPLCTILVLLLLTNENQSELVNMVVSLCTTYT